MARAFFLALAAGVFATFWWWGNVRYLQGYQAREIELFEARQIIEVELQRQAQISREAAAALLAAEQSRDREIQEALDALPSDARQLQLDPDALRLLRSIQ